MKVWTFSSDTTFLITGDEVCTCSCLTGAVDYCKGSITNYKCDCDALATHDDANGICAPCSSFSEGFETGNLKKLQRIN